MSECKKNCCSCAYKGNVPGSAHTECKLDWENMDVLPPKGNEHGIKKGWYLFPIDFDPVWQIEECKGFSETLDENMVRQGTPIDLIMRMVKSMI